MTRYTVCTLGYAQTMDISKARTILGYQPEKTLQDAIKEYGVWWKETHSEPKTAKAKESDVSSLPPISKPGLIAQVKVYHCGSCTNNLAIIYRKKAWESRNFPASAVLIRHQKLGNTCLTPAIRTKLQKVESL